MTLAAFAAACVVAAATAQHLQLPVLPYAYGDLEPVIDEATMRVHHAGHTRSYTDKTNAALAELRALPAGNALAKAGIDAVLARLEEVPGDALRATLRNQGGGYVNHELWFLQLAPPHVNGSGVGGDWSAVSDSDLARHLGAQFVSFDVFRELFATAASRLFGSGWVWLELDMRPAVAVLAITSTTNQDTPAFDPLRVPLLALDVWEHAYYLKHQNNRAAYVADFWQVVNWAVVSERYDAAMRRAIRHAGDVAEAQVLAAAALQREEEAAAGGGGGRAADVATAPESDIDASGHGSEL